MSRPSTGKKMERLQVWASSDVVDAIRTEASRIDIPLSNFCRKILKRGWEAYLKDRNENGNLFF